MQTTSIGCLVDRILHILVSVTVHLSVCIMKTKEMKSAKVHHHQDSHFVLCVMSFLPFHILEEFATSASLVNSTFGIHGRDDAEAREEISSQDELSSASNIEGRTEISMDGSSSFRSQSSVGSYEMQTGNAPGAFFEHLRERNRSGSFSGTILSSVASADIVSLQQPPQQRHDVWAVSPHPNLCDGNLSITTTESLYRDMLSYDCPNTDDVSMAASFLSLRSSTDERCQDEDSQSGYSSSSVANPMSKADIAVIMHDRSAFMNVANRLRMAENHNPGPEWFSRFTEQDWLDFRSRAEMVLGALNTSRKSSHVLALPPSAPRVAPVESVCDDTIRPGDVVPEAFVCSLCCDIIVGATSLSCGCAKSSLCTQCWEARTIVCDGQSLDGFVCVDRRPVCPFCETFEIVTTPCHALDVAILHVVKSLQGSLPIQNRYYSRLNAWRDEVIRRQSQLPRSEQVQNNEQFLAELIQDEEEFFWTKKRKFWHSPLGVFLREVAVVVAAASIASAGLSAIAMGRP